MLRSRAKILKIENVTSEH